MEEVKVEVGVTINIGKYSAVRLQIGATEAHSEGGSSLETHAADLYNRLEAITFRKASRLAKKAKLKMQDIGEDG